MSEFAEFEADADVREILKRNGIFEAHRLVAEYRCYRKRADGEDHLVMIRIYDMGQSSPNARYSWDVWVPGAEHQEPISANAADSIIGAGHKPHWRMLDTDGRRDERSDPEPQRLEWDR